jgi:hypothetical protein
MNTHQILLDLVSRVRCKPGWAFSVQSDEETGGRCLVITVDGYNSATPAERRPIRVHHWHPIPLVMYKERAWRRWIFECCRGVENHELGEWFRVGDERPFHPLHGPGELPYVVHEYRPAIDGLTTQDGSVRDPYPADPDQR